MLGENRLNNPTRPDPYRGVGYPTLLGNVRIHISMNKMTIFEHREGWWRKAKARDIRPFSTVNVKETQKAALLEDC